MSLRGRAKSLPQEGEPSMETIEQQLAQWNRIRRYLDISYSYVLAKRMEAVSYTHLDVYKRQVL